MKARIVYAAKESNSSKLLKLEEVHTAYQSYVSSCINQMIHDKQPLVRLSELRTYFPKSEILSSQILKNAQKHAVQIVETWIKGRYQQKLKKIIRDREDLTDFQKLELRCIGKYHLRTAGKFGKGIITREMIDLYWSWVWNPEIAGYPPKIGEDFPMWMSEMTCVFGPSTNSKHFGWWIRFSTLENGKRISIPLDYNPYLKTVENLQKSVLVKKRNGYWTFQFCEKNAEKEITSSTSISNSFSRVGIDVGLNVIAATSDGTLYGNRFKYKFDKLYCKVQALRANRQRQKLLKNSKRLVRLETKLSGFMKTAVGTVTNKLVKKYANFTFVIENLDLRGCRGQKRFAYYKLHESLSGKAKVEVVNPAFSSQMCPSCGYISKKNRSGIKFICRCCGRKSHADVVGGINLLGRSEDKQINTCESTSEARSILRERYLRKRNSSLKHSKIAPKPNGRKLTMKKTQRSIRTVSNQVHKKFTSYNS